MMVPLTAPAGADGEQPRGWPVRRAFAVLLVLVVVVGAIVLLLGQDEGESDPGISDGLADTGAEVQQMERLNRCAVDVPWRRWSPSLDLEPVRAHVMVVPPDSFTSAGQPRMRLEASACALRPSPSKDRIKSGDKFVVAWIARGAPAGEPNRPLCITVKFSRARLLLRMVARRGEPRLVVRQPGRRDYQIDGEWPVGKRWAAGRLSFLAEAGAKVGVYAGACHGTVVGDDLDLETS